MAIPGEIEGTVWKLMDFYNRAERDKRCIFRVSHPIDLAFKMDGIAGVEGSEFFPAKGMFQAQVRRDRAESRYRVSRRFSEFFVIAEDELFEDLVGLFEVFGLCEAQLDYKPLLEGLEGAFDAPFSLRGMGGDMLDAQLIQDTSDLG